ncbi:MAG: 5-formyltetrahydrofolate cyclo-ligase [Acidimicrobiia bacterium]
MSPQAPLKQALREEVWAALRRAGAARFPGVEGRIPNFTGAEAAAGLLAQTKAWRVAQMVKANPDSPQWPVRIRALAEGKVVYMAVPRLTEDRPFWRLDPRRLEVPARRACSIKGAARHGQPVTLEEMERIDLVVCGSVGVDRAGARVGKGGGYSDLEFGLTSEAGLIGQWTVTATTVHPVQMVEEGRIPMTAHDFPVDLVVTTDQVIETGGAHPRPEGILWEDLSAEKIAAVPALQQLRRVRP